MSSRAPNWFEQKYIRGAIMALQTEGWLTKGLAQVETNIKGITVEWKIAGTGKATVMSPAVEDRPVMNADRQAVIATMVDYEANDWILTTDIEKMAENEQQIVQQTAGAAMGRQYDAVLFATLDAAAGAIPTQGNGSAAISVTDLMTAQAQIAAGGLMGTYEWYVAVPFSFYAQLMLYREFSSADFVGDDFPLRRKLGARQFLGLTVIPMPDAYFNIPSAGMADGYMWMKQTVGVCTNYDLRSRIDYVATKKAYFAANTMGMTAATLLPTGIRRLRFATNVALARPTP